MKRSLIARAIVLFLVSAFLFPPATVFGNHRGIDGHTHADTREHCGVCNPVGPDGQVVAAEMVPAKSRQPRVISGRPDLLGLEEAAVEDEKLTPVVVPEAQGMERVQEYVQSIFANRRIFSDILIYPKYTSWDTYGDLGRYLQRGVMAKLRELKYAPRAPQTGQPDAGLVSVELGRDSLSHSRPPEFVFVLAYGFNITDTKGKVIDGRELARAIPRTGNDWVDGLIRGLETLGYSRVRTVIEGVLTISVYTPDGDLVKTLKGVARDNDFGKVHLDDARTISLGGVTNTEVTSRSSAFLAQRLVDAAFASPPATTATSTSPSRTATR